MRVLLALVLLCAVPRTASAHAILMESLPAAQGVMAPGPVRVVLRFNSRIDEARSRMELRPAGQAGAHAGAGAQAPSPALTPVPAPGPASLAADVALVPGAWVLRWQVLAVDGHITRGDVPFTVK